MNNQLPSEKGFYIRRAGQNEAKLLTDIAMRAKQSNGYDDSFMDACKDELTVTVSLMKQREYWVAEKETVCGFVSLAGGGAPDVGELHSLFIDPKWQRHGVGTKLWQKIVVQAKSKGMLRIQLDADPFAVSFYELIGFKTIANVPSDSIKGRFIPRMETTIQDCFIK